MVKRVNPRENTGNTKRAHMKNNTKELKKTLKNITQTLLNIKVNSDALEEGSVSTSCKNWNKKYVWVAGSL